MHKIFLSMDKIFLAMDKIFLSMDKILLPINGIFILQILYKILCIMFSNESLPLVGFSCLSLLMCDFEPKSALLNYRTDHLKNMKNQPEANSHLKT